MSARLRRIRGVLLATALVVAGAPMAYARGSQPQAPEAQTPAKAERAEPFAFADFTWLTGNPRTKDFPLHTQAVTGEFRLDTNFTYSFNHPKDDTITGSSEVFRSGELQVTQFGIGGDFHVDNVRGRVMTQFGMYSQTTPRNDASPARGQWNLDGAYRYVSEAYWRLPLESPSRHQRRRRHLHVLRGSLQLLPVRQLVVSALVRILEHAVVLLGAYESRSSRATG